MGEPTQLFMELARALVQALDAWAATVGQATDTNRRPSRQRLIEELRRDREELERQGRTRKKIDEPLLAYWLKGREQLLVGKKRNRLPSEEDSAAIARILARETPRSAEQLPGIGAEITDLARRLKDEGGTGWRDEVLTSLMREGRPTGEAGTEIDADGRPNAPTATRLPSAEQPPEAPHAENPPKAPGTQNRPEGHGAQNRPEGHGAQNRPEVHGTSRPLPRPAVPRPDGGKQPWRGRPVWIKALVSAFAVAVTAAIVVVAVTASHDDEDTGSPAQGVPAAKAPSDAPGLEKGTLGEDSRCSAPFPGPGAVTWRVCARVEAERVSFALKITNHGSSDAVVKTRLEYAQATKFHACPKSPNTRLRSIPAGKTVITTPGQCAVPRQDTPFAYQGVGWVLAENAADGSYQLSPTAHVHPDRTIWKPDLVTLGG